MNPAPPAPARLQAALDALERPAIAIAADYRIVAANHAYVRHYGALRVGVDRCHAVSHGFDAPCDRRGEACPLRACVDGGQPARVFHVHHGRGGPEHVDVRMRPYLGAPGDAPLYIEEIAPIEGASARADDATFLGRSPAFTEALGLMRRVAPSRLPVLLLGESGTGKELAARLVHRESPRRDGPFVPVECSGLPEALFESELFGHERGAFTGAHAAKAGLVEAAASGTLFLDEIGDVPLALQVKLLRLLESGTYRRVGGLERRVADFRLICATHRDLDALMATGGFRRDLFFRIAAFPIELPPLRARRGDVPLLAEALLRARGAAQRLSPAAEDVLSAYAFPGNVRELRNLIDRAALLCDGARIEPQHLPDHVRRAPPSAGPPSAALLPEDAVVPLADIEARYLRWARDRHDGDRRALAERLGVSERTLYRKLRALD